MIVSHRHRFIFLKTKKTAGSSVEVALSPVLGPDDVVTPVGEGGEAMRQGVRAQNTLIPPERREPWQALRGFFWRHRKLGHVVWPGLEYDGASYWPHVHARVVRDTLPEDVWSSYLKVSIERNPWDREVSWYFYRFRDPARRPSFETFVKRISARRPIDNFDIYGIDGRVVADLVIPYERLADGFAEFQARVGIPDPVTLPRVKGEHRARDADWRTLYTDETRDIVARRYAREIAAFGYRF